MHQLQHVFPLNLMKHCYALQRLSAMGHRDAVRPFGRPSFIIGCKLASRFLCGSFSSSFHLRHLSLTLWPYPKSIFTPLPRDLEAGNRRHSAIKVHRATCHVRCISRRLALRRQGCVTYVISRCGVFFVQWYRHCQGTIKQAPSILSLDVVKVALVLGLSCCPSLSSLR